MTAILLLPFTLFYALGIFLWEIIWRIRTPVSVGARVISVGGLTAGGSGKTSLTAFIASRLMSSGKNVSVVARGYRRLKTREATSTGKDNLDWREFGDEPAVIAKSVPGLAVYVDSDKTLAAMAAAGSGHDPIIVDDGFQHRGLKRDIDIVCLDGTRPFGNGMLLPSGRLREPPRALLRADMIVVFDPDGDRSAGWQRSLPGGIPVFHARKVASGMRALSGERIEIGGQKCVAFCGIGNPESFEKSLRRAGCDVIELLRFRDHQRYGSTELNKILRRIEDKDPDYAVTTFKDAVKLEKLWNYGCPLYYLEIEVEIEREAEFLRMIER